MKTKGGFAALVVGLVVLFMFVFWLTRPEVRGQGLVPSCPTPYSLKAQRSREIDAGGFTGRLYWQGKEWRCYSLRTGPTPSSRPYVKNGVMCVSTPGGGMAWASGNWAYEEPGRVVIPKPPAEKTE